MKGYENMWKNELYRRAKKRVDIKRTFKIHRNIYIATMAFFTLFFGVLAKTFIPTFIIGLSWGLGVAIHFIASASALKYLEIDSEIKKEIEYLQSKAGINLGEEWIDDLVKENSENKNKVLNNNYINRKV